MIDNKSILIVGVGGQGTLIASRILGSLAMELGYEVKLSEVHGMAQRGGSVVTHVKFGRRVFSPLIEVGKADIILAFEKMEALRWIHYLKKDGTVIVNDQSIDPMPVITGLAQYPNDIWQRLNKWCSKVISIDALSIAKEVGNIRVVNTVLLGVLAQKLGIPTTTWEKIIENTVPPKTIEINKQAFYKGYHSQKQDA